MVYQKKDLILLERFWRLNEFFVSKFFVVARSKLLSFILNVLKEAAS
jgi:hypothetical protein